MFKKLLLIQLSFCFSVIGMELAIHQKDHFSPLVLDCKKRIVSRLDLRSIESLKCASRKLNEEIDIEDSTLFDYFRDYKKEQHNAYKYIAKHTNNNERIKLIFKLQNNFSLLDGYDHKKGYYYYKDQGNYFFWYFKDVFVWDLECIYSFVMRANGSKVHSCDSYSYTALTYALRYQTDKSLQLVRRLLDDNIDINTEEEGNCITPLGAACLGGNIEVIDLLFDAGVDVNLKDKDGATALMSACLYRVNKKIIKLLLKKKPDVDMVNKDGATALILACRAEHEYRDISASRDIKVVKILLKHKAEVNKIDKNGNTALMHACMKTADLPIVRLLLAEGADVNIVANEKYTATALVCACFCKREGDSEVVKVLLAAGADAGGESGLIALGQACDHDDVVITQLLLEAGAGRTKNVYYERWEDDIKQLLQKYIPFHVRYSTSIKTCLALGVLGGALYYVWRAYSD